MEINFKGTQYDLPQNVTERTSSKLQTLKKYLGRSADVAIAYVELGKETNAHQSGDIWFASIRLAFEGQSYTARALEESIDTAVDRAVDEMSTELRRSRERDRSLIRKGGNAIKQMMRGMGT